jgi:hypothetical protein
VFPPIFEDAQDRKMAEKIGLLAEGGKRHCMQNERPGRTIQTTALVHEAYLRLIDVDNVDDPWALISNPDFSSGWSGTVICPVTCQVGGSWLLVAPLLTSVRWPPTYHKGR